MTERRPLVTDDGVTIDAEGRSSRPFIVGFATTLLPPPDLHCVHLPQPSATDPLALILHLVDAPSPRAPLTVSVARAWADAFTKAADQAEAQRRRS